MKRIIIAGFASAELALRLEYNANGRQKPEEDAY